MPRPEFGRPVEADFGALALLNLAASLDSEEEKWDRAKNNYGHGYVFDNVKRITLRLKQLLEVQETKNKVKEIASAANEGVYTTYVSLLLERAYPDELPIEVDDTESFRIKSVMSSIKEEIFGNENGGNYTDLFSGLLQDKFRFNNPDQIEFGLT